MIFLVVMVAALFALLAAAFYFVLFPKLKRSLSDDLLSYIGTVEQRLQPFYDLPGMVESNAQQIQAVLELMQQQATSYEASPRVLKTNIGAIMQSQKALVESQSELGRLSGHSAYLEGYVEGSQKAAAEASNRLGRAVHDVPLEMLERVTLARSRQAEGSNTTRQAGIRAELQEEKVKAEGTSLRARQKGMVDAQAKQKDMDKTGNELTGHQKRVAKALEAEVKGMKKRAEAKGTLEESGLKDFPEHIKNEADVLRFIEMGGNMAGGDADDMGDLGDEE